MENIVFLIFRRMRLPLITLILVYTVAILGLVLIPGRDAQGEVWHMSFFHAFYFVSYMSTTIGFGEIPFEFTDAQRFWVTICVYISVIAWLYAIGNILTLLQDKTFLQAISEHRLTRQIRAIRKPFYLICGYGETGAKLVKGLTDAGRHVVVVEIDEFRANLTKLDNQHVFVPVLHGDARKPLYLQEAGLVHPKCQAAVAVTNQNEANLKIAITSKLLHPHIKVICRSDSHDVEKNMASFGTDHIIDPFDTFATYLETAFQTPCLYLLQNWLFSDDDSDLNEPIYPPREGHWVVCGYGRFGKAVYDRLIAQGLEVRVIEAVPEETGIPEEGVVVHGRGTEADTLIEAGVKTACGLIAGTDNDANNLSIIFTARELNPELFFILRQNHSDNGAVIEAVKADMVMQPSQIIADKIRVLLDTPLLDKFITMSNRHSNEWACEIVSRISAIVSSHVPGIEEISINEQSASAVVSLIKQGKSVTLAHILGDPWDRRQFLSGIILLIDREDDHRLVPEDDTELQINDRLLICAGRGCLTKLHWNLTNDNNLSYIRTGVIKSHGWLWRKMSRFMN